MNYRVGPGMLCDPVFMSLFLLTKTCQKLVLKMLRRTKRKMPRKQGVKRDMRKRRSQACEMRIVRLRVIARCEERDLTGDCKCFTTEAVREGELITQQTIKQKERTGAKEGKLRAIFTVGVAEHWENQDVDITNSPPASHCPAPLLAEGSCRLWVQTPSGHLSSF